MVPLIQVLKWRPNTLQYWWQVANHLNSFLTLWCQDFQLIIPQALSTTTPASSKNMDSTGRPSKWPTLMSTALFWAAHSFEWPTLLSTLLSNKLFWELFLVIYSWEQFFEPSFERWNSFEHFFEHSQECTYSQEHFFEWIYSHECSFGHFLEGSQSTRTYLQLGLRLPALKDTF